MDRLQRIAKIQRLCKQAGCNDKIRRIHFDQFVDHQWHPHPPRIFEEWIRRHPTYQEMTMKGTDPREATIKLFNSAPCYQEFSVAKETGAI
jgi:hypothetical protein